jgi:transcriptional regulator with XRE-family HTH domain
MAKPLTTEQLESLRAMPLGEMPNKVRVALAAVNAKQLDLAADAKFDAAQVSRIVNGDYVSIQLETAQRVAEFFGCSVDDLFPRRVAVTP